jgi:hypothetical protein
MTHQNFWSRRLQYSYKFDKLDIEFEPLDPYAPAILAFKAFTDRIILAQNSSTAWHRKLHTVYSDLPTVKTTDEYDRFRAWVKDATMKHPQRRTVEQDKWLYIVEEQTKDAKCSIYQTVNGAIDRKAAWEAVAYDIDNLRVDPDTNAEFFFRNARAVKDVKLDTPGLGASCFICTEDFDTDAHYPTQNPCDHFQCKACCEKTLDLVSTKSVCHFCRACLVCNRGGCQDHVVAEHEEEVHLPTPLHFLLERSHMLDRGPMWCVCGYPLFGLSPKGYWNLREKTRAFRSALAGNEAQIRATVDEREIAFLQDIHMWIFYQIEHVVADVQKANQRVTE